MDMLNLPEGQAFVDLDDYKLDITTRMATVWNAAQVTIQKAQATQKRYYDRYKKATPPHISEGDRVMLYVLSEKNVKAYKFSRPFRGPYRVTQMFPNGAELVLISKPTANSIRVSLERVRRCPVELLGGDTNDTPDNEHNIGIGGDDMYNSDGG